MTWTWSDWWDGSWCGLLLVAAMAAAFAIGRWLRSYDEMD